MSASVSIKYTKEQFRNIYAMGYSGLRSIIPLTRPNQFPSPEEYFDTTIPPISDDLIDEYAAWCGAPKERYQNELPPHFCSHWALSTLSYIGSSVPYNVRDILNQGVHIRVKQAIPRGVPLYVSGRMLSVVHEERRIRIHVQITTGTDTCPDAHILDSYLSLPLETAKKTAKKKQHNSVPMHEIGTWSAGAKAGVNFARLTGDFNPIHVFAPLGRLSGFGGCILHGFGFMARSWERCRNVGMNIYDAELRFTKPLKIPTDTLSVQVSKTLDSQNRSQLNLVDNSGAIYLAGHIICN